MKTSTVLKEVPQNLSLQEAEPDFFHHEDNLDFEIEVLESRVAFDSIADAINQTYYEMFPGPRPSSL